MEGDRDTGRLTESAIVGAGIAGTALAIALRQSGLPVRLYDLPEPAPADPAPLLLTANGTRVLHAIGLKDVLADIASVPQFATLRHARTTFLLSQRPLGAFSDARYGAPDVLVNGAALTAALREHAAALGVPLEQTAPVTDIDAGDATLTLGNGEEHRHLAVAVASGMPTEDGTDGLRNLLNERSWQQAEDLITLRVLGERAEPSREHERFINTWVADGLIAVERAVPGAEQRLALTLLAPTAGRPDNDDPEALMALLLARVHPYLRGLLANPEVTLQAEPITSVAEYWFAEKMVLLGGACHAHPAFPELTASAALEDAWVLSRMMERWEETPHKGFADYERYRKPRARRLRAYAEAERATLAERSAAATWQRNFKWSLTSRFLPEIAMARTDWLYGYDAIKGFA